jgi:hypothetical protein
MGTLQILVRWYQKYVSWQLVTVHFMAEDRNDMEAEYYQIGTVKYLPRHSLPRHQ